MAKSQPKQQDYPTSMVAAPGSSTDTVHSAEMPPDSLYKGRWRNLKDGFIYKHCIWPHPLGRTHRGLIPRQLNEKGEMVHSGLYWEGTEAEWFEHFRKE